MNKKDNEDKQPKNNEKTYRALAYFSQIGITIAASVLIGVLIGRFLDGLLGTGPWMLLIFSLLGAGAAIRTIFKIEEGKKDDE